MCIGLPMQVLAVSPGIAVCARGDERRDLDTSLLPELAAGMWVLAHRGAAVRVLDATEAARIGAALDALEALMAGGTDIDAAFPDLAGRVPTLPAHLRGEPS